MTEGASPLRPDEVRVIRLSAALASGSEPGIEHALRQAVDRSDPLWVEEAILQSYLFLGYPAALNGLARWRRLSGRPAAADGGSESMETWARRGAAVCRTVYGGQYERLRANIRALHPDMERWMVVEGYGKVLGRPGLALELRELCIVAMLAVLNVPRQLYSHLRGALNAGASRERIEAALETARALSGTEEMAKALEVWREVQERRLRDDD